MVHTTIRSPSYGLHHITTYNHYLQSLPISPTQQMYVGSPLQKPLTAHSSLGNFTQLKKTSAISYGTSVSGNLLIVVSSTATPSRHSVR
mmetsp:Transcript_13984/g.16472  ORF Transcript_13984/g.16472 Transcript_13984/m.16472 type:complete len:89 (-) Transcript_13984:1133-1399(-)